MSAFSTLEKISQNKGDIVSAPLSNIEEISTRKSGWGYVKIAVSNEVAQKLLQHKYNIGGLVLTTSEEYNKYSEETK